uniref:Small ribosomal subunit protein mS35 mitochondrial conserved domain-containing protein n=1 Tax=Arion vulgaris TaxID=1028688 RepID=A0A0B7AXU3_9EUPU
MPTDQDWTNVWPSASTFKWSVVPFPVRQGYVKNAAENEGVIPSKYANLELMKGPNFLHLTPAHIKKHCAVLKQFCTKWPEGLETYERSRHHFPLETTTCDYLFSAPSIRDDRARIATLKFHLSDLTLDYHAKDKFIRLVGRRYDKETDMVVFESDRCPLKSQNLEFLKFVLTAVFFESWKKESWEDLKELVDMENYFWDINVSKKTCLTLLKTIKAIDDVSSSEEGRLSYLPTDVSDDEALCCLPEVVKYKVAVEELINEGENIETINKYKNTVKELLNIQSKIQ